jgi:hypothetical protein
VACVRGGWVALSALRWSHDFARRALAASHSAHPRRRRRRRRPGTARRRRRARLTRSTPLWVRSRATRGGPVADSEGHAAPQLCPAGLNRRAKTCSRPSRCKSATRGKPGWEVERQQDAAARAVPLADGLSRCRERCGRGLWRRIAATVVGTLPHTERRRPAHEGRATARSTAGRAMATGSSGGPGTGRCRWP